MLVAVIGTYWSERKWVVSYLCEKYRFQEHKLDTLCNEEGDDTDIKQLRAVERANQVDRFFLNEHRWRMDFVMSDPDVFIIEKLKRRPYFLVIAVDAPLAIRFDRFRRNLGSLSSDYDPESLEARQVTSMSPADHVSPISPFLYANDAHLAGTPTHHSHARGGTPLMDVIRAADVHLDTLFDTKEECFRYFDTLNLDLPSKCRPTWDTYWMEIAHLTSRRSNCMKRRVGAVLVTRKANKLISAGYNGTPRGLKNCNEDGCRRCNLGAACGSELDACICLHAEENALLEAGRDRVVDQNTVLYCTSCPCLGCAKKIAQLGITEVVYDQSYGMDAKTRDLFAAANIALRRFSKSKEKQEEIL